MLCVRTLPLHTHMKPIDFSALFNTFTTSAFRLEILPEYRDPSESKTFQSFKDGKFNAGAANEEWCQLVANSKRLGKRISRVRILPSELTSYLRYEIEWGYSYSFEAGEEIGLLLQKKTSCLQRFNLQDFWLFDDQILVVMDYDKEGQFLGGHQVEDDETVALHLDLRAIALENSITLPQFLSLYRAGKVR